MNLYAFQPNGHGELSFFVMAESEEAAWLTVDTEIRRRVALPYTDVEYIFADQYDTWRSDHYTMTVAKAGEVLTNEND